MDSANSGSLQSSSGGGDDEFESRSSATATATASFINNHQTLPNLQPFHHHHNNNPHHSTIFDPLSNYFDPRPSNPNPLFNLDPLIWSKPDQINPFPPPPPVDPPPLPSITPDQNPRPAVRNPKKRTRASRRAPTTVLTTDTTNFRAMVQEFTGIPAPPFSSSSSPFPRSRLDLFGTPYSIRSNPNNTFDNTPPPYLLRPLPQKLQPPPFLDSTSPSPPPLILNTAVGSNSTFQNTFSNQTPPSSSFLTGLSKTQENSISLLNDHQLGQVSGSVRDGSSSNYGGYSTGSFQVAKTSETMNGNATRGGDIMDSWICSTSD